jgi:hypothetical protein
VILLPQTPEFWDSRPQLLCLFSALGLSPSFHLSLLPSLPSCLLPCFLFFLSQQYLTVSQASPGKSYLIVLLPQPPICRNYRQGKATMPCFPQCLYLCYFWWKWALKSVPLAWCFLLYRVSLIGRLILFLIK